MSIHLEFVRPFVFFGNEIRDSYSIFNRRILVSRLVSRVSLKFLYKFSEIIIIRLLFDSGEFPYTLITAIRGALNESRMLVVCESFRYN